MNSATLPLCSECNRTFPPNTGTPSPWGEDEDDALCPDCAALVEKYAAKEKPEPPIPEPPAPNFEFGGWITHGLSGKEEPVWLDTTRPRVPLPPPRAQIRHDPRYGEWVTADGFSILACLRTPVIRYAGTRADVDLDGLDRKIREHLAEDIEEAQFREFGGPDWVKLLCGEPHDAKKAALWNAFSRNKPIDYLHMKPAEPPPPSPIVQLLREREFNPSDEPPPLRSVFSLGGTTVSTPANLTTLTAPVKVGKTAVVGAMVASAMRNAAAADLLGFSSSNDDELGLVWLDSEQSPDDFWHCVFRALKRAGLQKPPDWLHAYCLTGLGCKQGWDCVLEALKRSADLHDGIHSLMLDGVADFVADVNDAGESNAFVATLHGLAIEYDCPIVGVIHFNPGSEKSRGHLGSQLERKAESNLALEKDMDETTVIYSTKNRRAGIPKNLGPRFKFDVEAGMHVTVESRRSAKDAAERESLHDLAQDMFAEHPSMRRTDLEVTIKNAMKVGAATAYRKVARMIELTVITKSVAGLYVIAGKSRL